MTTPCHQNEPCIGWRQHNNLTLKHNKHTTGQTNVCHQRRNSEQANHKGAITTMHKLNRCSNNAPTINRPHAGRPTLNQPACMGRNKNGIPWVGDTMTARRQPYPRTQQNSATLPLYNQPTNGDQLLRAPSPPGERKLDRVRRLEHASRRAHPEARASSNCVTPTENQPRWGCLHDKASGPAPGSWVPEVGG